jgi:hypothetical protein
MWGIGVGFYGGNVMLSRSTDGTTDGTPERSLPAGSICRIGIIMVSIAVRLPRPPVAPSGIGPGEGGTQLARTVRP